MCSTEGVDADEALYILWKKASQLEEHEFHEDRWLQDVQIKALREGSRIVPSLF